MKKMVSADEVIDDIIAEFEKSPVVESMPSNFIAAAQNTDRVIRNESDWKYEVSIYYYRDYHKPPPDDQLPYYLVRLHDIYMNQESIFDVFEVTKSYIQNPRTAPGDSDGIFEKVLDDHQVPYDILGWEPILRMVDQKQFECFSDLFLFNENLNCRLKIGVHCSDAEPLGY